MRRSIKFAIGSAAILLIIVAHSFLHPRLTAAASPTQEEGNITVHNEGDIPIYVANYCKSLLGDAKKTSATVKIMTDASKGMTRPSVSACKRYIVFAQRPEELVESFSRSAFKQVTKVGIGTTTGGIISSNFYVTYEGGKLIAKSSTSKKIGQAKAMLDTLYDTEFQIALQKSRHFTEDPHALEVANIRNATQIPPQEEAFLTRRKTRNKAALERFLGRRLNGRYIPTIAFLNSGGGIRALISSLGMHVGAETTGLLDCITYDCGVSGGSWFVGLWEKSQLAPTAFKQRIEPVIARGLDPTRADNFTLDEMQNILNGVMLRKAAEQPVTLVTLYGAMLANRYLSLYAPHSQDILFSQLDRQLVDAYMPFPILTAVNGRFADLGVDLEQAEWFEFTPIEAAGIGSWLGNAAIPMWSVGRTFRSNRSIDSKPEYDLGQLMGTCGSAFAATLGRAFAESVGKVSMTMAFILQRLVGTELSAMGRASVSKMPNFTRDVAGSIVHEFEDLRLVDAGMSFNLPVPAVLHPKRRADIMIAMDAGTEMGKAIRGAERYAQHHRLPFPRISIDTMNSRALNIFEGTDPNMPTVIHLSRIVDSSVRYPGFIPAGYSTEISTLKFQYSPDEFRKLSAVTETNLVHYIQEIKNAIIRKIEQNRGFLP